MIPAIAVMVSACAAAAAPPSASPLQSLRPLPTPAASAASGRSSGSASVEPNPSQSQPPDTGGRTTSGDVPDNAVFLTYRGGNPAFSIQYVEGWQVGQQPDGVNVRDKDSSETVAIVAPQADVAGFVASTDLPALQAVPGFKLAKQDTVTVGGTSYVHLVYHVPAPPDPVTGKQVLSMVDRYYVPGPNGLAVVSFSTPDGVDNVDAFRQIFESFKWS